MNEERPDSPISLTDRESVEAALRFFSKSARWGIPLYGLWTSLASIALAGILYVALIPSGWWQIIAAGLLGIPVFFMAGLVCNGLRAFLFSLLLSITFVPKVERHYREFIEQVESDPETLGRISIRDVFYVLHSQTNGMLYFPATVAVPLKELTDIIDSYCMQLRYLAGSQGNSEQAEYE